MWKANTLRLFRYGYSILDKFFVLMHLSATEQEDIGDYWLQRVRNIDLESYELAEGVHLKLWHIPEM
jgi:hypothetical protein